MTWQSEEFDKQVAVILLCVFVEVCRIDQGFPTGGSWPTRGLSDPPRGPRDGLKLI